MARTFVAVEIVFVVGTVTDWLDMLANMSESEWSEVANQERRDARSGRRKDAALRVRAGAAGEGLGELALLERLLGPRSRPSEHDTI